MTWWQELLICVAAAVLILHETGAEYENDLAMLRLGDLANLLKSGKRVTILADKE